MCQCNLNSRDQFKKDLEELLNKYSLDNRTETPDFILSEFLTSIIDKLVIMNKENMKWHGWKGI